MKRDAILTIKLPQAGGRPEEFSVRGPRRFDKPARALTRRGLAAVHVVADPWSARDPWLEA